MQDNKGVGNYARVVRVVPLCDFENEIFNLILAQPTLLHHSGKHVIMCGHQDVHYYTKYSPVINAETIFTACTQVHMSASKKNNRENDIYALHHRKSEQCACFLAEEQTFRKMKKNAVA